MNYTAYNEDPYYERTVKMDLSPTEKFLISFSIGMIAVNTIQSVKLTKERKKRAATGRLLYEFSHIAKRKDLKIDRFDNIVLHELVRDAESI